MSTVSKAIFNILTTNAQVAPLVSNGDGTFRVHPLTGYLTENTPFITMQVVTNTPLKSKQIASVDEYRLQLNIVDEKIDSASDLALKVRAALDFVSGTFGGVNVQYCALETSQDTYEDGNKLNGGVMIVQDYLIRLIN